MSLRFPIKHRFTVRSRVILATGVVLSLLGYGGFSDRLPLAKNIATAQTTLNRPMTLRADVQEANSKTGVITARGNVQINYPARQIQATAAQAQYFSRERRIVLSGDVYVLQQGNSMRGETITYLMDEGRFVALPQPAKQVESIYLVPEETQPSPAPSPSPAPFPGTSEFSSPTTPLPPE